MAMCRNSSDDNIKERYNGSYCVFVAEVIGIHGNRQLFEKRKPVPKITIIGYVGAEQRPTNDYLRPFAFCQLTKYKRYEAMRSNVR